MCEPTSVNCSWLWKSARHVEMEKSETRKLIYELFRLMGGEIVSSSSRLSSYLQGWKSRWEDGVTCRRREKARTICIVDRTSNNGGKETRRSAAGSGQRLESDGDVLYNVAFHSFARCGVSAMLVSHCLETTRLPACLAPLRLHSLSMPCSSSPASKNIYKKAERWKNEADKTR
jgi:hypothetical protein